MTPEHLQTQAALAMVASAIIEQLKKRNWAPWFSADSDTLNRVVSASIALVTAAGFTWDYSGSLASGGVFTLQIPPFAELLRFASVAITSYGGQEFWYRIAYKSKSARS